MLWGIYRRGLGLVKSVNISGVLGGSVSTVGVLPEGLILGVTGRVTTLITGATSFHVGDSSDPQMFASNIAVALNTIFDYSDTNLGTAKPYRADEPLVLTAVGGNFTAGAVKIRVYYQVFAAPPA